MLSEWFYIFIFLCGDLLKRKQKLTFKEKFMFLHLIACLAKHLVQHYEAEKKKQESLEETTAKVMLLVEACRDFKVVNEVDESLVVNEFKESCTH
jgi:hypothetical protein